MLGWKLIYTAIAAIIYISLKVGFFYIHSDEICSYNNFCFTFCQTDRSIISDNALMENFKNSRLYNNFFFIRDDKITMNRRKIKCKNVLTYEHLILTQVINYCLDNLSSD